MKETFLAFILFCFTYNLKAQDQKLRTFGAQTGYEINEFKKNDIVFKCSVNKQLDTVKVWTIDPKFNTAEGYTIGTKFGSISPLLSRQVYKLAGYGYFIRLYSGWILAFCEGKSCTEELLTENSEVRWIEKIK
ncbi:MAG: hypothetical protein EOO43_17275 [Flavobacterium sp.]|nr:MAG: hypothetical protein EOO43_17275 [Flavobacterium sp.]